MLTPQELKKSPLFQDIGYENYQQMLDCFQAVQRSYRVDEVIYDFWAQCWRGLGGRCFITPEGARSAPAPSICT